MPPGPDRSDSAFASFFGNRTLRVDILTAFSSLLILTVFSIVLYSHHNNSRTVLQVSDDLISHATKTVIEKTTNFMSPASILSQMSSQLAEAGALPLAHDTTLEAYAIEVLKAYPQLSMFDIGDEKGNFLMPKKMPDGSISTKRVDSSTRPLSGSWIHRHPDGSVKNIETFEAQYDPRVRPWYKGAKEAGGSFWTDIYILYTDKAPGITAAYPVLSATGELRGVFGLDLELRELSTFLKDIKVGKSGVAFIISAKNLIVGYPDLSRIVKKDGDNYRPTHVDELGIDWVAAGIHEHESSGKEKFVFTSGRKQYIGSVTPFPDRFGKGGWRIAIIVPEDDFIGELHRAHRGTFLISITFLLLGVLLVVLMARKISRPIVQLTDEMKMIEDFQLEGQIDIHSPIKEIQEMTRALASMKTGLEAFGKYVPKGLVRQLISSSEEVRIGGERKELTIFFTDIEGFTTISERLTPEALMRHLSEYMDAVARRLLHHKGTVTQFIGDGVMAFWGGSRVEPRSCPARLPCCTRRPGDDRPDEHSVGGSRKVPSPDADRYPHRGGDRRQPRFERADELRGPRRRGQLG